MTGLTYTMYYKPSIKSFVEGFINFYRIYTSWVYCVIKSKGAGDDYFFFQLMDNPF